MRKIELQSVEYLLTDEIGYNVTLEFNMDSNYIEIYSSKANIDMAGKASVDQIKEWEQQTLTRQWALREAMNLLTNHNITKGLEYDN